MERIKALINRLQEQVSSGADAAQMQVTLQLLQSELNRLQSNGTKTLGTSKVAVVLPSVHSGINPAAEKFAETGAEVKETTIHPKQKPKPTGQLGLYFDPLTEIPTLSHQQGVREVNESVATQGESLNDKLKEDKTEVMHVLKDAPIRDLRKAIGINDRFVFISSLFRGDESMYERCIKTINSFSIYPEAEYWMNRELKVKLGWEEDNEAAQHFYQLVKRRFS
jgi:hypothetical protein